MKYQDTDSGRTTNLAGCIALCARFPVSATTPCLMCSSSNLIGHPFRQRFDKTPARIRSEINSLMKSVLGSHCKKPNNRSRSVLPLLGFEFFVVELLVLQAAKKPFGWRVIPAMTSTTHALFPLHHRQMLAVFPARILPTTTDDAGEK
jgi:hypothetical protein